jgi:hypothetical protein
LRRSTVTACSCPPMSMVKYLGVLATTRYGPLYGGASGPGWPPFLTYTISVVARCCGTVEGGGTAVGRVGIAFPARCWSAAAAGVSSVAAGCAGSVRAVPYTISAAEVLLSDLGAVLMFRRTQGRCCGQSAAAPLAFSPSFRCLWTLSTIPLLWGW